jgi:Tfp pilus assembly protein PilF
MEVAERAVHVSAPSSDPSVLADALLELASLSRWTGQLERGLTAIRDASERYKELSNNVGMAHCERFLGQWRYEQGQWELAEQHFERARDLSSDEINRANCDLALAAIKLEASRPDLARALLESAHDVYERHGYRYRTGDCWHNLGEIERRQGNLDQAEAHYRKCIQIYSSVGADAATVLPRYNLALVLIRRQLYLDAARELKTTLRVCTLQSCEWLIPDIQCAALVPHAALGDWDEFDRSFQVARQVVTEEQYSDMDIAGLLQEAGDIAEGVGQLDRARGLYHLARKMWTALGEEEAAQLISAHLLEFQ